MAGENPFGFQKNPWVYFFLFLAANGLISYTQLPLETKILAALAGIAAPLYVAFRTSRLLPPRTALPFSRDLLPSPPAWLWSLGLLALVFLRFYKLDSFPLWPNLDEGWIGTLAIELSKHWSWRFFYTFGETPPLTEWAVALGFKLGLSPALALWLPPALVSLLTVGMGYLAARQFFSRSFSLIGAGLMAFSFWPLFIGRVCHQGIWLPLWVCLVLYLWGRFQKARPGTDRKKEAAFLGLGLGSGSFTFTPWMPVAGFFILTFFWIWVVRAKKDRRNFVFLAAAFLVTLIPFLSAVAREGYGGHILSLTPWGGWFQSWNFLTYLFRYSAVLIWGAFEQQPAYTPVWGGFLNPLLGAFFWIGIIEMFRLRGLKLVQWVGLAFLFFLLPGALSPNLETFRIAQVLPLLLFVTALGIHSLLGKIPSKYRLALFGLCMAFTAILDFNLLAAPYRDPDAHPENFGRPLKSLERYRAYQVLNEIQKKEGPGRVLVDFDTNSFNDPTLSVMTYPFNSVRNPSLQSEGPLKNSLLNFAGSWTAIFVNVHDQPFLSKRFPKSEWYWASKDILAGQGQEETLGIFRNNQLPAQDFYQWIWTDFLFQQTDLLRFSQTTANFGVILQTLDKGYGEIETYKDPFLETCFWDKRASYEYKILDYDQQLLSYKMALSRGYPTADLYYKLGNMLLVKEHYAEAQKAFKKATQAPLDQTQARQILQWLKAQPAFPKSPQP